MSSTTFVVAPSNLEQRRAWDGDEGGFWARHAAHFDRAVSGYHRALLDAARVSPGSRVLDVGCGTGQTTRDAARIADRGEAVGVDLSQEMLEVARRQADRDGVRNVRFLQADAQVHPFAPASYDVVVSRTGTMFFGDPQAAFANLARSLVPGGRLAMVVWQPVAQNEWFRAIGAAMAAGRDLPAPPPDEPGPFALSEPARVRTLLTGAGFGEAEIEGLRAPMWFGTDADDAHAFILGLTGWMLADLDAARKAAAEGALHATMRAHETPRGVEMGSAMWLITAAQERG